jgi:hypothetical protein
MRRILFSTLVTALAAAPLAAQDAPQTTGPCRAAPCRLTFDWGGASAASHGSDRRYGPASDVETLLPQFLAERGMRVITAGETALVMTVRPKVRRAMCDVMAGTGTDYSCRTIGEIAIQFATTDTTKAPNAVRVTNRCGAGDTFMTVAVFARFTADMLVYQLADEKTRGRRPASKC